MRALVIYTSTNRKGRHDATGAFIPEANAFIKLHDVTSCPCDWLPIPQNRDMWDRRWSFRDKVKSIGFRPGYQSKLDAVVYFGHGTQNSLPGLGIRRQQVSWYCDLLEPILKPDATLVYYACLAGKGFGIADAIDVELANRGLEGVRSISHLTRGHTSINPHGEYSGEGPESKGVPIVRKGSKLWKPWVQALRSSQWFRLTFPFLDMEKMTPEKLNAIQLNYAQHKSVERIIQLCNEVEQEPTRTCPTCGQVI